MMDPERILERLRNYRLRNERFDRLVGAVLANRYAGRAGGAAASVLSGRHEQQLQELKSSLAKERQKVRRMRQRIERLTQHTQNSGQQVQNVHPPPVGQVSFGNFRQVEPISNNFGYDRGRPIDRYYIENFLARHTDDIRGRVLEIKDYYYTRKFGADRVDTADVLDVDEDNPLATIVADLTRADDVPSNAFDCILFNQTLQLIYDMRSAVQTLHRILKPGGVLLATFPGITQINYEDNSDYWCWSFTQLSVRRLFAESFPEENIRVEAHGNVLSAIAFLHGLAAKELRRKELDYRDPDYEVVITLRAVKPEARP